MADTQQSVQRPHTAAPTAHETVAPTTVASQASTDPIRSTETSELSPESRPELNSGLNDGTTTTSPPAAGVISMPKEEKVGAGEVMVESQPINEGVLNYKGPGLKGLIFSKKYFWFNDSPLEHKHLSAYLGNEKSKDIGHANAAHAQQTGKGLLFFAKRAEDKDHPQGMFNLADITDFAKGNFNDFSFSLHGHKHTFQAVTKVEKDGWIVAIGKKAEEAKTSREGIVGSSGYKSALEKLGAPAAATTTGTSRSLSRPGKKASKSRERKVAGSKTDNSSTAGNEKATTTPAGVANEYPPEKTTDHHGKSSAAETGEAAVGGAAVGVAAGAATRRSISSSDEDKKAKKSRSQSRNKRGSLFGNLLAKKEDHDVKKDIKKEEKEEKADQKVLKKEEKELEREDKAERKEEKLEAKAEKQELKEEAKTAKHLEKESSPEATGLTPGFNAHAVASRVVGEPIVPAEGNLTGAKEATPLGAAETTTTAPSASEAVPTSTTRDTAPKPNKRASLFGGFFGKKDAAATPTAMDAAPVVPAKDEPSAVSTKAPQLDNPVTEPVTEPATGATTADTPVAATGSTTPGATVTPTDKRRSSFFSNLGTKKERRTGTTSGDELTDNEGKRQSQGGFSGLLRKASRAQKGSSGPKDAADVPLPKESPTSAAPAEGAVEPKSVLNEGEAGTTTAAGSHGQTPVSTAA